MINLVDGDLGSIRTQASLPVKSLFKVTSIADTRFVAHDSGGAICYFDICGSELIPRAVSSEHKARVLGIVPLPSGGLVSWLSDGSLIIWHSVELAASVRIAGHQGEVYGAIPISNGRILSWGSDGLRFWDQTDGCPQAVLETSWDASAVCALGDGRVIALSDGRLLVSDGVSKSWLTRRPSKKSPVATLSLGSEMPRRLLAGMEWVQDNTLVSWTEAGSIQFWNMETYQLESQFDAPWTDNLQLVSRLSGLETVANARRSGSLWIENFAAMFLSLASQAMGEVIRWHGHTGQLFFVGNSRIVSISEGCVEVLGMFRGASDVH